MRIKAEQLPQYLEKHLAPLYTIFGNEPLLVIEATDLIRKKARKQGFTEQEIFVIDNTFRWPDLLNTCNNPSLFGEQKLIDVRLPTGKPGREGGKVIEDYCRALPQNKAQESVTLITLPKMDKQSQSTKWFKAIENAGIMIPIYTVEHM